MASAAGSASWACRQVVVGDDEIQAQPARGFCFGKGAHAGVDGDDEANALGVGRFEHARLHAVAVAQAMRDMKTCHAAEHFDGGFEQDDGDGSVHVVVAVEKHRFARGDGALETVDGIVHAQHEEGIVQMGRLGIEEGEGLSGGGDAARDEQFGEHKRQARLAGQGGGFFRMRLGEEPALRRRSVGAAVAGSAVPAPAELTRITRPRRRANERRRSRCPESSRCFPGAPG